MGEEREGGEGRALAGGKGPPVAFGVGGALQTAVGARPTSGGSQSEALGLPNFKAFPWRELWVRNK